MEIHPSARRHGVLDDDILHGYEHSIAWIEVGDDPLRYLLACPDRADNMLEIVVLVIKDTEIVIHAMPLRRSTEEEFFGGEAT